MDSSHRRSLSHAGAPPSPRVNRYSQSFSSAAVQDLLNNPPLAHRNENAFAGRDWRGMRVEEVVDPTQIHWAETDTTVEDASNLLISAGSPNVVLVRESKQSNKIVSTFDFSDLNAYLLLVVGIAKPGGALASAFGDIQRKAHEGKPIKLQEIKGVGGREEFVTLPHTAGLTRAVEIFGSGVHRLIILHEKTQDVVGVLTQLRLVRYFWENGRSFPAIESVYARPIKELAIRTRPVVSINGDRPVAEALDLMNRESITSLPVLDAHRNVVGNISHVDVRLLTKSTSIPLLSSSCIHFISVILSERGMTDGKDSYPVFHVSPFSTLAHTIAKLVATVSHRMWIVDAPSPSSSASATPAMASSPIQPAAPNSHVPVASGPPYTSPAGAVPASSLPGQHMSGRLSGVISLTDVLNAIARASGLNPQDPDEARRRRRRDSSSSSLRASIDSARSSSVDLHRAASVSGSKR